MAFDVDTAKADLGIVGNAQDNAIQRVMDIALNIVEKYLDRFLLFSRQVMAFKEIESNKIWVPRYPIVDVFTVNGNSIDDRFLIHYSNGWIRGPFADNVELDYSGGYKILPPDLEYALWLVFMPLWEGANQQTGGIGQDSSAVGDIDSVTIQDIGTVRFGGNRAASNVSAENPFGFSNAIISILEPYKRWSC